MSDGNRSVWGRQIHESCFLDIAGRGAHLIWVWIWKLCYRVLRERSWCINQYGVWRIDIRMLLLQLWVERGFGSKGNRQPCRT